MASTTKSAAKRFNANGPLNLVRRSLPSSTRVHCEAGKAIAAELLEHLNTLAKSWPAGQRVTGIGLGCRTGGWMVGESARQSMAANDLPNSPRALADVTYDQPASTESDDTPDSAQACLSAAVNGILNILLKQCHGNRLLSDSEGLHRVILEAISDVAFLTDEEGNITFVCPNAEGFCGRSYEEYKRMPTIFELLGGEGTDWLRSVQSHRDLRDVPAKLLAADGREVCVLTDVKDTGLPGSPFLFTFRDVTELAKSREGLAEANLRLQTVAKELTEKNIALRELLYQIDLEAHDIRTTILTNIELQLSPLLEALRNRADSELRPVVTALEEALQSISRKHGGEIGLERKNLTPRELQICSLISSGYSSKQIASALSISPATVVNTRKRIRRKLGISSKTSDLVTVLRGTNE